jgi:hypothetical protein
MRSAGNFHPQWGYLAPAPSFLRTARTVIVATAVGATAGAAVVLSLLDRSEVDAAHTSVAAHALVTSAEVDAPSKPPVASTNAPSSQAQASMSAPVSAATPTQTDAQPQTAAAKAATPASDPHAATDVATSMTVPSAQTSASVAAAAPAAIDPARVKNDNTPTAVPETKKVSRKRFASTHYAQPRRYGWGRAPGLMQWPRFFTSQSGPSYPNYRGL